MNYSLILGPRTKSEADKLTMFYIECFIASCKSLQDPPNGAMMHQSLSIPADMLKRTSQLHADNISLHHISLCRHIALTLQSAVCIFLI